MVVFTNLSIPSVIFADASWYGSLRGGVQFKSDQDAKTSNYGSRWGIKGSSEAGEGLTAVYKFETRIGSSSNQSANQLYVGLSGGFGNLTLGKIPGAINVHNGMRNQAYWESHGDELLGGRYEALSYAISAGSVSAQLDLIMDGATDTGKSIDGSAFGMTAALGDIGKLSVGYEKREDATTTMAMMGATPSMVAGEDALKLTVTNGKVDKTGSTLVFRTKDGRMAISDAVATHTITDRATGKSNTATLEVVIAAAGQTDIDTNEVVKIGGKFYDKGSCVDAKGALLANVCTGTGKPVSSVQYVTTTTKESTKGKDTTSNTYHAYTPAANGAMLANMDYVEVKSKWGSNVDDRGDRIDSMGRYLNVIEVPSTLSEADLDGYINDFAINSYARPYYKADEAEGLVYITLDLDDDPDTSNDIVLVTQELVKLAEAATDKTANLMFNKDGSADGSAEAGVASATVTAQQVLDAVATAAVSENRTPAYSIAHTAMGNVTDTVYGANKTHISAEFGLGAVTLGLGHSQEESNDPMVTGKTKTNYLGMQGSLGDTGLNWLAWGRSVEAPSGTKTNPWMVGINKSLGGGAFTFVEHTNADDDSGGTTHVAFGVNF